MYGFEIKAYQVSTGLPHPDACHPHINMDSLGDVPIHEAVMEITGDIIVMVIPSCQNDIERYDGLWIFNWKSGELIMVNDN